MIAKVQADADDLARPRHRRPEARAVGYSRRLGGVGRQPIAKALDPVTGEEVFVVVRRGGRDIDARAVGQLYAGALAVRVAETQQFHSGVMPHQSGAHKPSCVTTPVTDVFLTGSERNHNVA